ncbi:MAG: EAL domain-containing protein [Phormidesmis sp.]
MLCRISCLLHCPINTPQLWSQVLSVLGDELDCSAVQLFLSASVGTSAKTHYSWYKSGHHDSPRRELADRCECLSPSADKVTRLWQYFDVPMPSEVNESWHRQATDLQDQLAGMVSGGFFQLSGTQTYTGGSWPAQLVQLLGPDVGCHLALLPLSYQSSYQPHEGNSAQAQTSCEQDFVGVLVLARPPEQGEWSAEDIHRIEAVGSQIYLAIRRSRLDQITNNYGPYDQLTQLPDRILFNQQLVRSIRLAIEQDTMLGVAFLDLDRFKNINDTLGHEMGDCLLQQVAERLKSCLRSYDVVTRWGGDEFTLLLSYLRSPEDVSGISERILQRLAAPFYVQGEELYITASLGLALAPYDGQDGQTLLRNADAAMYQAKARGRNNYQIYFEEINANARKQLNLENDFRKALDNNELFLCYQPQVNLRSGAWIGLEALIRWQHPTLGVISPNTFIPIAEETGLIEPIGRWILQSACLQYVQWQQQGFPLLRLAVNLSAHQFRRSHLVRSVVQTLNATGFDPRYLELEVTESAAMYDVDFAIGMLKKLTCTGIQIAMDDFGTGYSSLSVLKHFPLDTIKIDRSFVKDLVNNPSDAAIASAIIALAKGLNFKVLAEGIETFEQAKVLSEMGCDYAQGYWYSRPLTAGHIDELLAQGTFFEVAKL